tara:strand:+ start:1383 stop:1661 length:279 start_codon:yes stop_codon:yes gene_type:complete
MVNVLVHSHSDNTPRSRYIRFRVQVEARLFYVDTIVPLSGESLTIVSPGSDRIASVARHYNLSPFDIEREVLKQMSETSEIIRKLFNWGDPT